MKKLVCIFVMMLVLAGCGSSSEETTNACTTSAEGGVETQMQSQDSGDAYVFEAKGVTIAMNAKVDSVLAALGETKSYFESESCAFKGLDKQFTYNGFVLTTYPIDGQDFISGVQFLDDTVETPEGITIGSSLADVESAYGSGSSSTSCQYEKGDCRLLILLEDEVVTSVQYVAITE